MAPCPKWSTENYTTETSNASLVIKHEITQGQNFNTSGTVLWDFFWTVRRIHGNFPEAISKLHRKTCFPFGNKGETTSVTLSDQFT